MSTIIKSGYALDASSSSMVEIADFIRFLDEPLKHVRIDIRALQSRLDMRDSLRTIHHHCSQLEDLRLTINYQGTGEDGSWFDLSPILLCSRLKRLWIKHPRVLPIVDDDVFTMLSSWEDIQELSLNPEPTNYRGEKPELTVLSLVYVAQMGPKLHDVGLCIDLGAALPETTSHSWSSLSNIHLGLSTHDGQAGVDLLQVAEFINDIFPAAQVSTSRIDVHHLELEERLELVRSSATGA
ncbi:hypothetical protein OE88DRAFT_637741 [Heliocybe sulcata]|uniref:F-box domain-containing protein n=1 Tax=Heliocybe sulcata TaxID=5364 RepID=A0A5C3NGI6_9AGAM|nr:hypothetical protein OE88DRAFT_637741 [Heliocybe sulcata]